MLLFLTVNMLIFIYKIQNQSIWVGGVQDALAVIVECIDYCDFFQV